MSKDIRKQKHSDSVFKSSEAEHGGACTFCTLEAEGPIQFCTMRPHLKRTNKQINNQEKTRTRRLKQHCELDKKKVVVFISEAKGK